MQSEAVQGSVLRVMLANANVRLGGKLRKLTGRELSFTINFHSWRQFRLPEIFNLIRLNSKKLLVDW